MSRTQAIVALTALSIVFVLGLLDYLVPPYGSLIPVPIAKLVSAVLVGITIGLVLSGLRRNGHNGQNGGGNGGGVSTDDRASMRGGLNANDPNNPDVTGGDDYDH